MLLQEKVEHLNIICDVLLISLSYDLSLPAWQILIRVYSLHCIDKKRCLGFKLKSSGLDYECGKCVDVVCGKFRLVPQSMLRK